MTTLSLSVDSVECSLCFSHGSCVLSMVDTDSECGDRQWFYHVSLLRKLCACSAMHSKCKRCSRLMWMWHASSDSSRMRLYATSNNSSTSCHSFTVNVLVRDAGVCIPVRLDIHETASSYKAVSIESWIILHSDNQSGHSPSTL